MKNFVQKICFLALFFLCLNACTYTISIAQTHGISDDVIDDTSSASPNISPRFALPSPIPGI